MRASWAGQVKHGPSSRTSTVAQRAAGHAWARAMASSRVPPVSRKNPPIISFDSENGPSTMVDRFSATRTRAALRSDASACDRGQQSPSLQIGAVAKHAVGQLPSLLLATRLPLSCRFDDQ